MALSSQWTLTSCTDALRRELLDPTGRWWTDSELANYCQDYVNELNSQFEFVWTISTYTMTLATGSTTSNISPILALSTLAPILRLDAVYFTAGGTSTNIARLSPRSIEDLDRLQFDWRSEPTLAQPELVFQLDAGHVQFWPPPPGTGTYIFEYPVLVGQNFVNPTDPLVLPPWVRYGIIPYGAYRALTRFGSNQDLPKAARYKRRHELNVKRFRRTYDAYFPKHAGSLRPGRKWAGRITNPRQNNFMIPGSGGMQA